MQDGTYTFYVLEWRGVAKSPLLNPGGKLSPVEDDEWSYEDFDKVAEPWYNWGNTDARPQCPKSDAERQEIEQITRFGWSGWWSLKYAIRALRRVMKADEKGKFDYYDGYGNHEQAVRHEFRVTKMTISQKTEPVDIKEVVKAL